MAYKTFTAGSTLPVADVNTYLMNQAAIVCTSGTRPGSPPKGMVIYQTDTNDFYYCSNATGPVWTIMTSRFKYAIGTSVLSDTTTTFVKDTGCGDLVFTSPGTLVVFRVRYVARAASDAGGTTIDFRIYDGGASSPTTASTQLAGASIYLDNAGSSGATTLECEAVVTGLSAGTHTIAGFYARTAGSGNVHPHLATGGARILSSESLT